jgi:hypothetical protein
MNALLAEVGDALNPLVLEAEPVLTFEEVTRTLNPELVREFKQTPLQETVLEEFVYAVDHLDEMIKTNNFPKDRLLNSPDVAKTGSQAVNVFNDFASRSHDKTQWGCSVGPETMASIQEFFDHGYLGNIALLMKHLRRESVMFVMDSIPMQMTLNRHTPHPEFGVLVFANLKDKTTTMVPFHLTRLESLH